MRVAGGADDLAAAASTGDHRGCAADGESERDSSEGAGAAPAQSAPLESSPRFTSGIGHRSSGIGRRASVVGHRRRRCGIGGCGCGCRSLRGARDEASLLQLVHHAGLGHVRGEGGADIKDSRSRSHKTILVNLALLLGTDFGDFSFVTQYSPPVITRETVQAGPLDPLVIT